MPDPFHATGVENATLLMSASGQRIEPLGRVKPDATHYAALWIAADDCRVSNGYIEMNAATEKGISVHGDELDGGTVEIMDITIGPATNAAQPVAVQIDPGSTGQLDYAKVANIVSANCYVKVAQCRVAELSGITIEDVGAYTFGVTIAENVERLSIVDSDIDGWISQFPDPLRGEPLLDELVIARATVAGRIDHVQAKRLTVTDTTIDLGRGLAIGIDDETPTAEVVERRFIRVDFVGTGTPYFAGTGFGDPTKVTAIGCTHNGVPWTP